MPPVRSDGYRNRVWRFLSLIDPQPENIHLDDIAHHLSMLCRFGGACKTFYSVAEHCVLAWEMAVADGMSPFVRRSILMHDAHEAYTGDLTRPVRQYCDDFNLICHRIQRVIEKKWDLEPDEQVHHIVKDYDNTIVCHEARELMPSKAKTGISRASCFAMTSCLTAGFRFGPSKSFSAPAKRKASRKMVAKPVTNKADFYRRFTAGEFGNHGPMWETYRDYRASGYRGNIAIRTRTPGGRCDYHIPRRQVPERIRDFRLNGYGDEMMQFSAMAPDDKIAVQGEAMFADTGLKLFVSFMKVPMRVALLAAGRHIEGLRAAALLRHYADPDSFDWIMHLLEEFPGHTVEFGCYTCPWGVVPGRNTVIWEVRR